MQPKFKVGDIVSFNSSVSSRYFLVAEVRETKYNLIVIYMGTLRDGGDLLTNVSHSTIDECCTLEA